jgi:hypothetical protein
MRLEDQIHVESQVAPSAELLQPLEHWLIDA